MPDDPRDELSNAERRAFEALPREVAPRAELEERVVAALQQRGVLPTPIRAAPSRRRGAAARRMWIPLAAAASISIFTTGLVVGQYLGSRSTALAFSVGRASAGDAARMQRAGTLYIQSLAALAQSVDSVSPERRDSARAVALRILSRAAEEMALLAPDDPLAAAVLRVQNQRSRTNEGEVPSRSVVWY